MGLLEIRTGALMQYRQGIVIQTGQGDVWTVIRLIRSMNMVLPVDHRAKLLELPERTSEVRHDEKLWKWTDEAQPMVEDAITRWLDGRFAESNL